MLTRLRKWTGRKTRRTRKHGARNNGCDDDTVGGGGWGTSKCSEHGDVVYAQHREPVVASHDDISAAPPLEPVNRACKQPEPQLSKETLESIIKSANALASRTRTSNRSSIYDNLSSIAPSPEPYSDKRSSIESAEDVEARACSWSRTSFSCLYSPTSTLSSPRMNPPSSLATMTLDPKNSASSRDKQTASGGHLHVSDTYTDAAACGEELEPTQNDDSLLAGNPDNGRIQEPYSTSHDNDSSHSNNCISASSSDFVASRLRELAELEQRWQVLFDRVFRSQTRDNDSDDSNTGSSRLPVSRSSTGSNVAAVDGPNHPIVGSARPASPGILYTPRVRRDMSASSDTDQGRSDADNSLTRSQSASRGDAGRASQDSVFTFDEEEVERESRRSSERDFDSYAPANAYYHHHHQPWRFRSGNTADSTSGSDGNVIRRSSSKRHRPRRSSPLAVSARNADSTPLDSAHGPSTSPRQRDNKRLSAI